MKEREDKGERPGLGLRKSDVTRAAEVGQTTAARKTVNWIGQEKGNILTNGSGSEKKEKVCVVVILS